MLSRSDGKYGKNHDRETQVTSDGEMLERQGQQTDLVFKGRPTHWLGGARTPALRSPAVRVGEGSLGTVGCLLVPRLAEPPSLQEFGPLGRTAVIPLKATRMGLETGWCR